MGRSVELPDLSNKNNDEWDMLTKTLSIIYQEFKFN